MRLLLDKSLRQKMLNILRAKLEIIFFIFPSVWNLLFCFFSFFIFCVQSIMLISGFHSDLDFPSASLFHSDTISSHTFFLWNSLNHILRYYSRTRLFPFQSDSVSCLSFCYSEFTHEIVQHMYATAVLSIGWHVSHTAWSVWLAFPFTFLNTSLTSVSPCTHFLSISS